MCEPLFSIYSVKKWNYLDHKFHVTLEKIGMWEKKGGPQEKRIESPALVFHLNKHTLSSPSCHGYGVPAKSASTSALSLSWRKTGFQPERTWQKGTSLETADSLLDPGAMRLTTSHLLLAHGQPSSTGSSEPWIHYQGCPTCSSWAACGLGWLWMWPNSKL